MRALKIIILIGALIMANRIFEYQGHRYELPDEIVLKAVQKINPNIKSVKDPQVTQALTIIAKQYQNFKGKKSSFEKWVRGTAKAPEINQQEVDNILAQFNKTKKHDPQIEFVMGVQVPDSGFFTAEDYPTLDNKKKWKTERDIQLLNAKKNGYKLLKIIRDDLGDEVKWVQGGEMSYSQAKNLINNYGKQDRNAIDFIVLRKGKPKDTKSTTDGTKTDIGEDIRKLKATIAAEKYALPENIRRLATEAGLGVKAPTMATPYAKEDWANVITKGIVDPAMQVFADLAKSGVEGAKTRWLIDKMTKPALEKYFGEKIDYDADVDINVAKDYKQQANLILNKIKEDVRRVSNLEGQIKTIEAKKKVGKISKEEEIKLSNLKMQVQELIATTLQGVKEARANAARQAYMFQRDKLRRAAQVAQGGVNTLGGYEAKLNAILSAANTGG